MSKPRILIADDHRIVVEGLRALLGERFELAGVAADGRALLDLARTTDPDVIVADISMPLLNGIEALHAFRGEGGRAKWVFLTMHSDAVYATRALAAGALGYVLKHAAPDELVTAIDAALEGRVFLSPALRTPAMDELLDPNRRHVKATIELTARQREVLQLVAEGKSAKEIAAILDISPRTAETHKYKIMDGLGVSTTAELVQHAIRHGLVARGDT